MVRPGTFVRTLVLCGFMLMVAQAFAQNANKTIVMHPDAFAVSGPVREMLIAEFSRQKDVLPVRPGPLTTHHGPAVQEDAALQTEVRPLVTASVGVTFSGLGANGFAPSDVNLAVGPNDIIQTVNVQFAVYNKTGTLLHGPVNFTTFFSALGGDCTAGASDPIALYDRQADRWVISDIGIGSGHSECYGVSKTNDPTGAYFLYAFSFGSTLNDYDKVSVWPTASNSAYLSTYNLFKNGSIFIGAGLCGFDRTKALAGDKTAAQLCQQTPNNDGGYLPSDNDGPTPPADGTPGLFLAWFSNNPGQLYLRKLTLNFSAGTSSLSSPTVISVANQNVTCGGNAGACVPQSGTTTQLDTLGDRLMYRFPVRHFADHDRAVANHAVATSGGQVAFRWYELYDPAGTVTLNQQGTFAPDNTYRWMGSMAEDQNGDIAIGYSASSSTIHPSINFTGRVPGDPAGTLETEASILVGTASQTNGLTRWGDYTGLQVDPTDDCTFWYTNQYEPSNGSFNWATNIASFKFAACGGGTPGAKLSTTSLNFSKEPVGQTSAAKSVMLTNNGTATLDISSITISGDYAISAKTCGSTLAVGANCKVKITFTPSATGTRTGTLSFNDNAPGSPQTVALTGVGTALALTPVSWNFGSVTVGNTSSPETFTVTNETGSTVGSISISLGGTNPSDFSITSNGCGSTLAGHSSCNVTVVFKPLVQGTLPASLIVKSNGVGNPQTARLTGKGM